MDYCGKCGASLRVDQRFCRKCGVSLREQRAMAKSASPKTQGDTYPTTTDLAPLPLSESAIPNESKSAAHGSDAPFAVPVDTSGHPRATQPRRRRKSFRDMTRREWAIAIIGGLVGAMLLVYWINNATGAGSAVSKLPTPTHIATSRLVAKVHVPATAATNIAEATVTDIPTDTAGPTVSPADIAAMKAQITGAHICKGADYGGSMPLCSKDAPSLSQANIDGGAGVSFAAPAGEPNDRFPAGSYTLTVYEIDAANTPNQIGTVPLDMQSGNGYIGWKLSDVISIGGLTLNPGTTYELELDGPVIMGVAGQARFTYVGDGTTSASASSATSSVASPIATTPTTQWAAYAVMGQTNPTTITLATGVACSFMSGATAAVGDLRANYDCTSGQIIYGNLNQGMKPRSVLVWRGPFSVTPQQGQLVPTQVKSTSSMGGPSSSTVTPTVSTMAPNTDGGAGVMPTATPGTDTGSSANSLASDEGGTGPTAECNDGTTSYSQHPSGTCSYHGGVAVWDDHLQHSTP